MSICLPAVQRELGDFKLDVGSLELPEGLIVIVGRNGSGKSSYAEGIATAPVKGQNRWHYLPQYLDRFLFGEHILGQLQEIMGEDIDETRLQAEVLQMGFGSPDEMIRFPFQLMSGGERRRIALAAVFYLRAPAMILDEPEIGLGQKESVVLKAKLNNLTASGGQVMVISHTAELIKMANHVIGLEAGGLAFSGSASALFDINEDDPQRFGIRFG